MPILSFVATPSSGPVLEKGSINQESGEPGCVALYWKWYDSVHDADAQWLTNAAIA